ncbi:MAG: hypothetical protein LLF76_10795 [Planctomycetaceae bacterium]|nr:hypothetical protein [Planctomycetaceae bacterium]
MQNSQDVPKGSEQPPQSRAEANEDIRLNVSIKDLFGGDLSAVGGPDVSVRSAKAVRLGNGLRLTCAVLALNLLIAGGFISWFVLFHHPSTATAASAAVEETAAVPELQAAESQSTAAVKTPPAIVGPNRTGKLNLSRHAAEALAGSISLESARQFAQNNDFYTAAYIYEQLQLKVTGVELKNQLLRDWLSLQMAVCLQRTNQEALTSACFTDALSSKSMVVRAMTNYSLSLTQINQGQFLEARSRALQAMSLLKVFAKSMPATMEADCYFIAAEALTRYLLLMTNRDAQLPAAAWSDSMKLYELPILNQEQLCSLLMSGADRVEDAVIVPKIDFHAEHAVGSQWSVTAIDTPLEQLLWQYGSASGLKFAWDNEPADVRLKRATLCMPFSDRRQIAEVITGSAGLIWHYDGDGGTIYDPSHYKQFDKIKKVLTQEAISAWQRFLLYYRTDERTPSAHYCLGRLFAVMEEPATALGEYKLVASQSYGHELAPYALLEGSRIKTGMLDYQGAREDLNELLIQYPNCKVVDTAILFLAEATMKSSLYAEAADLFNRAWQMNIGAQERCSAVYGLGRCAYEMKKYDEAANWLTKALQMTADENDLRVGPACFLLGHSYIELHQYAKASSALKRALGKALDNREYVQIIVDLVESERRQENYLQALTILEDIPEQRLNQEDACEILSLKARIYRDIDLPDSAISLLRRRIEFITEAPLRAKVSVELAQCYLSNGELEIAAKQLGEAFYELPEGLPRQQCGYLLAQTNFKLGQLPQAQSHCLGTLGSGIEDSTLRADLFGLLGEIYNSQKMYEKAALAYAGVLQEKGAQ